MKSKARQAGERHPPVALAKSLPGRVACGPSSRERGLFFVEIDGKPWTEFDAAKEWVRLPRKAGEMKVIVHFH